MVTACWSLKGGSGTTTVAAALAMLAGRRRAGALLVDLAGDAPALMSPDDEDTGPGVAEWLRAGDDPSFGCWTGRVLTVGDRIAIAPRGHGPLTGGPAAARLASVLAEDPREVIIDCGVLAVDGPDDVITAGHVVARRAGLSVLVTRACTLALRRMGRSSLPIGGVIVVRDPDRVVGIEQIEAAAGAPVIAEIPHDPVVARVIDTGRFAYGLPASLEHALTVGARARGRSLGLAVDSAVDAARPSAG
jgi:hypothetical protein